MSKRLLTLICILAAGLALSGAVSRAWADKSGRYRVTLHDNKVVEGELKEVADGYEVTTKSGIQMKLLRNQVKKLEKLEDARVDPAAAGKSGGKAASADKPENDPRFAITDAMIAEIIGSDAVDAADVVSSDVQDLSVLPVSQPSLSEMMKLANTGAGKGAQTLERDHFVLVYTSPKSMANELGSRLEAVYTWVHKFMKMLDIPSKRPDTKLEIFFYNTNDEYVAYGNNVGGIPPWAAGFYMHTNNRSAFYDMNDEPYLSAFKKRLEERDVYYRARQFWENRIKAWAEYYNITVIQHEAAHHIHFNVGLFPRRGHTPHWLAEGLAQMFELPPGKTGGSLGSTNYFRLEQFHEQYDRHSNAVVPTRLFISDDSTWDPGKYPHGWAFVNFLWKKHREKFGVYLKKVSQHEEDQELTETQKQQEFEDVFGPADDKFHKDFLDYTFNIPRRRSVIPPPLPQ